MLAIRGKVFVLPPARGNTIQVGQQGGGEWGCLGLPVYQFNRGKRRVARKVQFATHNPWTNGFLQHALVRLCWSSKLKSEKRGGKRMVKQCVNEFSLKVVFLALRQFFSLPDKTPSRAVVKWARGPLSFPPPAPPFCNLLCSYPLHTATAKLSLKLIS